MSRACANGVFEGKYQTVVICIKAVQRYVVHLNTIMLDIWLFLGSYEWNKDKVNLQKKDCRQQC